MSLGLWFWDDFGSFTFILGLFDSKYLYFLAKILGVHFTMRNKVSVIGDFKLESCRGA